MMLHVGAPAAASHQGLSSSTNTVFLIKMCLNSSVNSALYFTWSSVRYLSYFFKFKFNSHGMEFYFSPYSLLNSAAGHLTDLHSTGNCVLSIFQKAQPSVWETPGLNLACRETWRRQVSPYAPAGSLILRTHTSPWQREMDLFAAAMSFKYGL